MYAKIDGDVVAKYPYTMDDLKKDNPFVGFPTNSISNPDISSEYGVVSVGNSTAPDADAGFKVEESTPVKDGERWVQGWSQVAKTAEEIAEDERVASEVQEVYPDWHVNRRLAYGREIEQIEFITENGVEAWQAKVAEIKALYPKT
tara:strand:- start:41 stop:478 length:438 start_codon:yes stop_codon:yes gene_type:complete